MQKHIISIKTSKITNLSYKIKYKTTNLSVLIRHEFAHQRQQFAHQQAPATEPAHDDDEYPARGLPHLPHSVREYASRVVRRQLVQYLLRKYFHQRFFCGRFSKNFLIMMIHLWKKFKKG